MIDNIVDSVVNVMLGKISIENNPAFKDTFSNYTQKYNEISEKATRAGIDIKVFLEFVEAIKEIEHIRCVESYRLGYKDAEIS